MTRTTSPNRRRGKTTKRGRSGGGGVWPVLAVAGVVVGFLFVVFLVGGGSGSSDGSGPPYAVGNPGPGEQAPPLRLPSASGGTFDLGEMEGERVLLYFQEGIMCQPCWDQLSDIEARWDEFDARGIDAIASITSDGLDPLRSKVELEGLSTPVLSDPGVEVSRTWEANLYGMMGTSMNGHSFVLVGPDGEIEWRADYGGAPDYTMYVPVDQLLAHLDAGTTTAQQS